MVDLPAGFRVVQPGNTPPASPIGPFPGMLEQGNIDLNTRPIVKNPDGSYSTVRSMSFGDDSGREILVPTVSPDGKIMSDQAASDLYGKTGQNLGKFDTPAHADMYAEALHKAQDQHYGSQAQTAAPAIPDGFKVVAPATAPAASAASPAPAAQPEISTAKDVGQSFASGVPRGIVETAMFPVTLSRMVEGAGNYLYNKAENGVRYAVGAKPLSEEELARRAQPMGINGYLYDAQDAVRGGMDEVLHKPQTTAGKFAGTLGEFAAPGGLPSKGVRAAPDIASKVGRYVEESLGNVVAPALASETAGQATEGTPYEGLSRFLGALFGNVAAAGTRAHSAPEATIRRATEGTTDAEWQAAQALQDNNTGIALSSPEAVAQARGGASKLPDLLRVVEGSVTGGNKTGPFFAQRPAQIDRAVGGVLDQVAPQSAQPSTLGPRAAEAATNVIDQTRQGINAQTRPLYQAADTMTIPAAQFAALQADPRFAAGLQRLRANAELAPDYAHLPDNSVGVIDAVTKDLLARGEALSNAANPLYGPELAGKSTTAAMDARNAATVQSPEYAQALAEQEALRRTQLNPLEQGPVGRVAAAKDTKGAGNAVLPQNPLAGSAPEAADAVTRLAAQDPETTAGLVRQNLADRYATAQTETQGGGRETAGAKFHQSVAGNDQRSEVLNAVLRALPGGQAAASSMDELLNVLAATQRRHGPGSATESNRMITSELGAGSPVGKIVDLARTLGTSFFTQAGDAVKRAQLRGNLADLADILTGPNAVQRTRAAADSRPRVAYPEAVLRSLVEGGQTLYDPRGSR